MATHAEALEHYAEEAQRADIVPRSKAIAELCSAAMRLAAYGRTMNLSVHALSREQFDSFDGDETRHESETGDQEWWAKTVRLHDGIGRVELHLYTDEPPAPPAVQAVDTDALDRLERFADEAT